MNELTQMLRELCEIPSVSGTEGGAKSHLLALAEPFFDEVREDRLGNFIFIKKSQRTNAPRLMLDAHLDEVGMMVSEIHEGGFLSVVAVGGLDTRVLGATEVTIHGKREIYGIITSTPPHILEKGEKSVPQMTELYIDTGYSKKELEELVRVGDTVDFRAKLTEIANNRVIGKSLDDKACVCALLTVAMLCESSRLMYDLYVTVSAQEETGKAFARFAALDIQPDIAIVTDVNFASGEGIREGDSIEVGKGASIDISAITDIMLTRRVMALLDAQKIPYQRICEPSRTSTNADAISKTGKGARTLVMSIPLASMHTPCELVCLDDIVSMARILLEIAYTPSEELL